MLIIIYYYFCLYLSRSSLTVLEVFLVDGKGKSQVIFSFHVPFFFLLFKLCWQRWEEKMGGKKQGGIRRREKKEFFFSFVCLGTGPFMLVKRGLNNAVSIASSVFVNQSALSKSRTALLTEHGNHFQEPIIGDFLFNSSYRDTHSYPHTNTLVYTKHFKLK